MAGYPSIDKGGDKAQLLSTTAFGELTVAEPTPVVQISAQYGLTEEVMTIASNGGATGAQDSLYEVSTGTDPLALASLNTLKQLHYRPGQGALARLTAIFNIGVAGTLQAAGLITSEDAFAFGYVGDTFGIIFSRFGVVENQELTISSPATGTENATVTINDVAFVVPLTAGDADHTAQEVAASLTAQVPNYLFTANNNEVTAMSQLPQVEGTYAFTSGTAAGTWSQVAAGAEPDITLIPQSKWNRKKLLDEKDGNWILDPQKGNVYSLQIQYLGFGNIEFFVENPITGNQDLVHMLEYANKNTSPVVSNPTFRIGWVVRNLGNTTNITLRGASAVGFIQGRKVLDALPRGVESVSSSTIGTTQTNMITIRNRFHFGDKINRADIIPLLLSLGTESSKGAFFRLTVNSTFNGDLNFSYIDKGNSIAEVATDQVEVIGGRFVASFLVTSTGIILSSSDFQTVIFPDDQLTLSAAVTANPAAIMTASAVWQEDA